MNRTPRIQPNGYLWHSKSETAASLKDMSDAPARQHITRTCPSASGASHRRALQYSAHYRGCALTHLHTEWNANRRAHSAVHRTSPTLNAELTELAARLPKFEQLTALFRNKASATSASS
ncbi:hypothetical protein M6B38_266885 [Iris pallida]|uniref:Uncharacterized protein n=1 Tax=Iris pallida TaxID=29817 RepID=A0AAX6IBK5_IRIPA|nr:hypothetical protein M6B38_266885 [Iris pallida]